MRLNRYAAAQPSSPDEWDARNLLFQIVIAVSILAFPTFVLFNLNRGLDLSDTGFYYVSIQHLNEYQVAVSQFGTVWNLLPIPDSIIWNRVTLYTFLLVSGGFMANEAVKFIWPRQYESKSTWPVNYAVGAASISTFYIWWLPDPSYNSMALWLNVALIGVTFRLYSKLTGKDRVPLLETVFIGFLSMALILTRPQTAIAIIPVLFLAVTQVGHQPFKRYFQILGFSCIGAFLFVMASWVLSESPITTFNRTVSGLQQSGILGAGTTMGGSFAELLQQLLNLFKANFVAITLVAFGVFFAFFAPALSTGKNNIRVRKIGSIILLASILFFTVHFLTNVDTSKMHKLKIVGMYIMPIWIISLFFTSFSIIQNFFSPLEESKFRKFIVILIILFALLAQIILTGNNLLKFSGWFAFYPLIAIFLLFKERAEFQPSINFATFLIVMFALQFSAFRGMTERPYRLNNTLATQSMKTEIRNGKSSIFVDAKTHSFLTALTATHSKYKPSNERPYLIDATGRYPMVTYHLDMKSMAWPWLLSGYKGSPDLFEQALLRMKTDNLAKAWILNAPDYKRGHSTEKFKQFGIDLENDYTIVLSMYRDDLKSDVLLMVPKSGLANKVSDTN